MPSRRQKNQAILAARFAVVILIVHQPARASVEYYGGLGVGTANPMTPKHPFRALREKFPQKEDKKNGAITPDAMPPLKPDAPVIDLADPKETSSRNYRKFLDQWAMPLDQGRRVYFGVAFTGPHPWVALEIGAFDLGRQKLVDGKGSWKGFDESRHRGDTVQMQGADFSVLVSPVRESDFRPFLRLGAAGMSSAVDIQGSKDALPRSQSINATFGVGVAFKVADRLGVRVEDQFFFPVVKAPSGESLRLATFQLFTVSVRWRF